MAKIKGRGIVYGANGKVVLAGTITQINTISEAELTDESEIEVYKDSNNKTKTLVVPEEIYGLRITLQPGGTSASAATLAEAAAQSAVVKKLDNLVVSDMVPASFNQTYVIWEASWKVVADGPLQCVITARKFEADFSAAALTEA